MNIRIQSKYLKNNFRLLISDADISDIYVTSVSRAKIPISPYVL